MSPLIPGRGALVSLGAALLVLLIVFFAGFRYGRIYDAPVAVPQLAHAQQGLGGGNVLAAKAPAPVAPATVVPAGTKALATAHVTVSGGKPRYVPDSADSKTQAADASKSHTQAPPTDCLGYISHLECPARGLDETLVKDKAGQLDLIAKGADGSSIDQAIFNPGTLATVPPSRPWLLGVAIPLGIPGSSKYGLAVGYQFQRLPVQVGMTAFTVEGRGVSGIASLQMQF